jgi:predicted homoserine dehydrogenase-like protein
VRCVALADCNLEAARSCAAVAGAYRVVESVRALEEAVALGVTAVCEDGLLPAMAEGIDVFLESSNAIAPAGASCLRALDHGKHVVLMNAEVDLVFGPACSNWPVARTSSTPAATAISTACSRGCVTRSGSGGSSW